MGLEAESSQEAMFAEYARTGDRALRDRLVEDNLGLANHLAKRFANRGEPLDDLTQVASMALIGAVERFEPERGVAFPTFAVRTILGELKRHFRDKGWAVRAPRRLQELYLQLNHLRGELEQTLGRPPTVPELAQAVGTGEEEVIEALSAASGYRSDSLDAPGPDGETLGIRLGGEDPGFDTAERRAALEPLLERLPDRERRIIVLRFVGGLTQSEIAARSGISQMQVSRLLNRSLTTLRALYGEGDREKVNGAAAPSAAKQAPGGGGEPS